MASLLIGLDAVLCILVVLAALDYLRVVFFMDQPLVSLAFYLVAIGAFGGLINLFAGVVQNLWTVMLHLGVVVYAASHYQDIFQHHWSWNGQERRHERRPQSR